MRPTSAFGASATANDAMNSKDCKRASDHEAAAEISSARREVAVAAIDAYVKLMQRSERLSERVAAAFTTIDRQLAALGRDRLPIGHPVG
jgi:hypothetical protein